MTTTQRQLLEAEFPKQQLDSISKGGSRLTYVPVAEVINRLNDVLTPGGWSWKAEKIWRDTVDPSWVLAYGTLTATIDGKECSMSGSGGVKIKLTTTTKEAVDLGDEFKGAESDALKKAAQRLGVALYLSRDEAARRYEAPQVVRDPKDEGWDSAERQKQFADELTASIKALPRELSLQVKARADELGVIWPPTMDEYTELNALVASLAGSSDSGSSDEGVRKIGDLINEHFPGASDVSPPPKAPKQKIDVIKNYLADFTARKETAAKRAFTKYAKEKGYPYPNVDEMTEAQADEAIDFIESLA